MAKSTTNRLLSALLCALLALFAALPAARAYADVAVDGDYSDWGQPDNEGAGNVYGWSMRQDASNYYVLVVGNQYNIEGSISFGANPVYILYDGSSVMGQYWQPIPGATTATSVVDDLRYVEICIPKSYAGQDCTVSYCGTTFPSANIPDVSGGAPGPSGPTKPEVPDVPGIPDVPNVPDVPTDPPSPDTPNVPDTPPAPGPGVAGIVIDGAFADWTAIPKNQVDSDGLEYVGMVWDGDHVYIYFETADGSWNRPAWSGPYNNGKFAITTDLGRQLVFQVGGDNSTGPVVSGVDGASAAVSSMEWGQQPYMWEISIPASQLPDYMETITLQYLGGEKLVSNVANLQGSDTSNKVFNGIVIDGLYDDWRYYPHQPMDGNGSPLVSNAAVYTKDGVMYGHVEVPHAPGSGTGGDMFTQGFSIKVNGNSGQNIGMKVIAVDPAGNITWNPQKTGLPEGDYEYYLVASSAWENASNVSELNKNNLILGRMMIGLAPSGDNMEFEVYYDKVAEYMDMNKDDFKEVEFNLPGLGSSWVSSGGVSTGPVLGIVLCVVASGVAALLLRRRRSRSEVGPTEGE